MNFTYAKAQTFGGKRNGSNGKKLTGGAHATNVNTINNLIGSFYYECTHMRTQGLM
jgi:hypothetical protein